MRTLDQQDYLHYVEVRSEANMAKIFSEEKSLDILNHYVQASGLTKSEITMLEDKYQQDMNRIFEEHGII